MKFSYTCKLFHFEVALTGNYADDFEDYSDDSIDEEQQVIF